MIANLKSAKNSTALIKKSIEYSAKNSGIFSIEKGIKNKAKNPKGMIKKLTKGIATKLAKKPTRLRVWKLFIKIGKVTIWIIAVITKIS